MKPLNKKIILGLAGVFVTLCLASSQVAKAQASAHLPNCVLSGAPLITWGLTVPPDGIYRNDEITLRWEVRYSDGRPWDQEINFVTDPPLMRANIGSNGIPARTRQATGSHTFRARWQGRGIIRLVIRCGGSSYVREIVYDPIQSPHLDSLSVSRAGARERVTIHGRDLGSSGEVELVVGGTRAPLRVQSWTNSAIEVSVPEGAPVGSGYLHIFKGRGHLQSNSKDFQVVRVLLVDRGLLQLVHDLLGLSRVQVHLDDGGSFIRFTEELKSRGARDRSFSVPRLEINPSDVGEAIVRLLSPVTVEKLRYTVNDINLNSITSSISGGQLVIRISFESNQAEVIGKARIGLGPFGVIDGGWDNSLAPDLEANNLAITVRLTPIARDGVIQLTSATATFDGDFRINNRLINSIARHFADFENRIKSAANEALVAGMESFTGAFSNALMAELRRDSRLAVNRILSVTPAETGNSLRVVYE